MIYLWFTLNYPTWSIRGWGTWAPASTLRGDRDIVWSTSGQVTWQNLVKPNTSFNWNWRGQTPCPPYANIGPPSPTASPNSWWGKAAPPAVTDATHAAAHLRRAGFEPLAWSALLAGTPGPSPLSTRPWKPTRMATGCQPSLRPSPVWSALTNLPCPRARAALVTGWPTRGRSLHDGPHKPRIHPRQPPFPHPAAMAAAPPPRPRPGPMQLRRRPWPARRSPAACPPDTSVFARPRWNAP